MAPLRKKYWQMARAKRHYLPGHVWHLTHRCHKKEFLLKFARDRRRWLQWLFEAKKRYGLCILNYIKEKLGIRAKGRKVEGSRDLYHLRETQVAYNSNFNPENDVLSAKNTYFWRNSP
jgi:hypothetical protein